eukprot:760244-Hanusia_phi.AAC.3
MEDENVETIEGEQVEGKRWGELEREASSSDKGRRYCRDKLGVDREGKGKRRRGEGRGGGGRQARKEEYQRDRLTKRGRGAEHLTRWTGKVPFIIRRHLPNGSSEDWAVNELIIEHVSLTDRYQ